jgi:hypothetical protein
MSKLPKSATAKPATNMTTIKYWSRDVTTGESSKHAEAKVKARPSNFTAGLLPLSPDIGLQRLAAF